jgi:small conductance mechanosensitive channel
MDIQNMFEAARPTIVAVGLKVAGAIALYIVGRWLIGIAATLVQKALERQRVDPTIVRYVGSAIGIALNILLVIGILGYFGVETTSFAALIAALGIAIGAAWGGLLSNFAAVCSSSYSGHSRSAITCSRRRSKVRCGRLAFSTTIDSPDNVQTYVGNSKVMNGTIKNFSTNAFRRADLSAQLDHSVDPADAVRRLKDALPKIANVLADPPPTVEILTFNERGPVLAVRPFVHTDHYWQVYSEANLDDLRAAGYPAPVVHQVVHQPTA